MASVDSGGTNMVLLEVEGKNPKCYRYTAVGKAFITRLFSNPFLVEKRVVFNDFDFNHFGYFESTKVGTHSAKTE